MKGSETIYYDRKKNRSTCIIEMEVEGMIATVKCSSKGIKRYFDKDLFFVDYACIDGFTINFEKLGRKRTLKEAIDICRKVVKKELRQCSVCGELFPREENTGNAVCSSCACTKIGKDETSIFDIYR